MTVSPIKRLAMACTVLSLVACATPSAQRWPAAATTPAGGAAPALPERWMAPLPDKPNLQTAQTAHSPPKPAWWRELNEPALEGLVLAAQAASPNVASAAARIERARAQRVAAGAALLPSVDVAARIDRGRASQQADVVTSKALGVQAAWEIDLFGASSNSAAAASARLNGASVMLAHAQTALAAETATSYVSHRACQAKVQQIQADAQSREETARLTRLRTQVGFSAPADAALADASAAQGRGQSVAQQAACDALLKSLVELTALDESSVRERLTSAPPAVPQPGPAMFTGLPVELLSQRPDLQDAAWSVAAAAGDEGAAQAALWPRLTLAASSTTGAKVWSLGPLQVSFPLFDAGQRRANVVAARASYDEAVVLYQAQLRRAVREVEQALVALRSSEEGTEHARVAAQGFEASLRATDARQRAGLASLFELQDARRSSAAAQAALIDVQRDRTVAWIDLVRASGGGWRVTEAAPLPSVVRAAPAAP
jgi:outer membrane protein, multidrug efflux system